MLALGKRVIAHAAAMAGYAVVKTATLKDIKETAEASAIRADKAEAQALALEHDIEAKAADLERAAKREVEAEERAVKAEQRAAIKEAERAAEAQNHRVWLAEQELKGQAAADTARRIAERENEIKAKATQTFAWAAAREKEVAAKIGETRAWAVGRENEIAEKLSRAAAVEQAIDAKVAETQAWATTREQDLLAKIAETQVWAAEREKEIAEKQARAAAAELAIEEKVGETEAWAAAKEQEIVAKIAETKGWATAQEREIEAKHDWAERREDALRRVCENLTPSPFEYTRRSAAVTAVRPQAEQKIFGIGWEKTGTTSLEAFFKELGFTLGDQANGALLLRDWALRNFDPIVDLARSAQFFQDIPFSLPFTYTVMDREFPGAKFILSIRSDTDEWYTSVTRFLTNLFGKGVLPTEDDLITHPVPYIGWAFESTRLIDKNSEVQILDKTEAIRQYENHNASVVEYFRHRPESLLVVNLADRDAAEKVMTFVGLPYDGRPMPHLNKSSQ